MKPLITSVLDLDSALGGNADLLLGGGLGLYLKQQHLRETEARTLLAMDRLPPARSTQDVDLFLRAEVIASADEISRYRAALDKLGFRVVRGAEWLKFSRDVQGTEVRLDVMVGPLGKYADCIHRKDFRVRPKDLEGKSAERSGLGRQRRILRSPHPESVPLRPHEAWGPPRSDQR